MHDIITTYYHSPLGLLKIAGTEDFIAEVSFDDKVERTEKKKKNLPPLIILCIEQLIQYFHGELRQFDLPVNQPGTKFQLDVWSKIQSVGFGKTLSYLELARKIGDVKAIRAVAAANGRNNVAIIIPCHRIIGSNRELVGYAGGIWRKKWLLEHEAKVAYGVQTLL